MKPAIAIVMVLAIIVIALSFMLARLLDERAARNLHAAHRRRHREWRRANKRRSIITESGRDPQIVGDGAWPR